MKKICVAVLTSVTIGISGLVAVIPAAGSTNAGPRGDDIVANSEHGNW